MCECKLNPHIHQAKKHAKVIFCSIGCSVLHCIDSSSTVLDKLMSLMIKSFSIAVDVQVLNDGLQESFSRYFQRQFVRVNNKASTNMYSGVYL